MLYDLRKGENYIINISRSVIGEALSKWSNTFVVALTSSPEVLEERLRARARDSPDEVKKRLEKEMKVKSDIVIDTSSPDISIAGEEVVNYVKGIIHG